VFASELRAAGDGGGRPIEVVGSEAHHALRVKRLRTGDAVELFDGLGRTLAGVVAGDTGTKRDPVLLVEPAGPPVDHPRPTPAVEVCAPAPKGDRLDWMLDQLSQAGATAWRPLVCERGERDPRPATLDRLARLCVESAKQCGRAWVLEIGAPITLADALDPGAADATRILAADAAGGAVGRYCPAGSFRLLVGPEGGWSPRERTLLADRGAAFVRLGPFVLRTESAAAIGAAILMHAGGPAEERNG
jgi:16S rRNA (uracil1498-N3)-methyltransferase